MKLIHHMSGDGNEIVLPNNVQDVQLGVTNKNASIYATHEPDGRVGETAYRVSVQHGTIDDDGLQLDTDTYDYVEVIEDGFFHGRMRVTIVTLSSEVAE